MIPFRTLLVLLAVVVVKLTRRMPAAIASIVPASVSGQSGPGQRPAPALAPVKIYTSDHV